MNYEETAASRIDQLIADLKTLANERSIAEAEHEGFEGCEECAHCNKISHEYFKYADEIYRSDIEWALDEAGWLKFNAEYVSPELVPSIDFDLFWGSYTEKKRAMPQLEAAFRISWRETFNAMTEAKVA